MFCNLKATFLTFIILTEKMKTGSRWTASTPGKVKVKVTTQHAIGGTCCWWVVHATPFRFTQQKAPLLIIQEATQGPGSIRTYKEKRKILPTT